MEIVANQKTWHPRGRDRIVAWHAHGRLGSDDLFEGGASGWRHGGHGAHRSIHIRHEFLDRLLAAQPALLTARGEARASRSTFHFLTRPMPRSRPVPLLHRAFDAVSAPHESLRPQHPCHPASREIRSARWLFPARGRPCDIVCRLLCPVAWPADAVGPYRDHFQHDPSDQ